MFWSCQLFLAFSACCALFELFVCLWNYTYLSSTRYCVMTDSRGEVLVTLVQNPGVVDKWFVAREDSQHSRDACLQKPDKLVKIVQRYLQWLGSHKYRPWNSCEFVRCYQSKQWSMIYSYWKSPRDRASKGPPYSQGGTGKYGFESDQTFVHSANLLMKMNGEHLGTGAGAGLTSRIRIRVWHERDFIISDGITFDRTGRVIVMFPAQL